MNLAAGSAIAVREFKLAQGHGFVDFLLFLDGRAVGVCEAKPAGFPVRSVEVQTKTYVDGVPAEPDVPIKPQVRPWGVDFDSRRARAKR